MQNNLFKQKPINLIPDQRNRTQSETVDVCFSGCVTRSDYRTDPNQVYNKRQLILNVMNSSAISKGNTDTGEEFI